MSEMMQDSNEKSNIFPIFLISLQKPIISLQMKKSCFLQKKTIISQIWHQYWSTYNIGIIKDRNNTIFPLKIIFIKS